MPELCSFSYTAFTLSGIYLLLFCLVVRYLLNLVRQHSAKKRAQKLFLVILLGQTILRVVYFITFPFSSDSSCEPSMKGNEGEDTRGAAWWIHLLSNVPAVLFLMAFSVLVYTFARIYHKVLLAGVWYQERRFKILTVVLALFNVVALVATFGDWAYASTNSSSHLSVFVDMLMFTILSVSFLLALCFLAYGTLLYYQVQSIIRASCENVGSGSGMGQPQRHYTDHYNNTGSPQLGRYRDNSTTAGPMPSETGFTSEVGTGFTPIHSVRRSRTTQNGHYSQVDDEGQHEGQVYQPPSMAGVQGGINLSPAPNGLGVGFGTPQQPSSAYPVSNFASPNLPIRGGSNGANSSNISSGGGHTVAGSLVAHSYVSANSYSPEGMVQVAIAASDLSVPAPPGPDGLPLPHNPSSATGPERLAPVPLGLAVPVQAHAQQQHGRNYVSSVSPEYSHHPSGGKGAGPGRRALVTSGGTTKIVGSGTPTDQLVGSAPYEPSASPPVPVAQQHTQPLPVAFHTPKKGSGLSRPGVIPHRTLSHSPPEDEEDERMHANSDTIERGQRADRERAAQMRGLTNSTSLPNGGYPNNKTNGLVVYRTEDPHLGAVYPQHAVPLLEALAPSAPPPNPMRKIAIIAAICTVCLLLRTILLITIAALSRDFNWYTTLLYFTLSEILPLLAMLFVFGAAVPVVPIMGAQGGGGGF